jgi:hypothetical protein
MQETLTAIAQFFLSGPEVLLAGLGHLHSNTHVGEPGCAEFFSWRSHHRDEDP